MIESIDPDRCSSCGHCVEVCPMDVFRRLGEYVYIAHQQDCMTCFLCEEACSLNAIYVDPHRGRKVVFPF
ncbi:MAG: ferredoxin family protein [Thermodesulfobacteriota bacterium]